MNIFYKAADNIIKRFDDHSSTMSESKHASFHGNRLKILTPKQMFQRLLTALAHVQAGNTTENLINEIQEITYSIYQAKEINKKVYNNIMNLIKL